MEPIVGFSKLSKLEKIQAIIKGHLNESNAFLNELQKFWHQDEVVQKTFDEFSENTISNFYIPFGVVPNVMINNKLHTVPMVIEESSVVAACSKAANFWLKRGGIKTEIVDIEKSGQVHLNYVGDFDKLNNFFNVNKESLINSCDDLTLNMRERGGGINSIELLNKENELKNYFQLDLKFNTCDAMGANFINSVLERVGKVFVDLVKANDEFNEIEKDIYVIMSILSNYTPNCRVRAYVECPITDLIEDNLEMDGDTFAKKFQQAILISEVDTTRAVTHNKGIMNGVDAVVVATGNDFRAIEACVHAYASRSGKYRGLSYVKIQDGNFHFGLELPLAIGTIGGLTSLHPLSKFSLELLGLPNSKELMQIIVSIGLLQNFAAVKSLVTSGIQKGHMKMHLMNILNHLEANEEERQSAKIYFENEVITFKSVRDFVSKKRNYQ